MRRTMRTFPRQRLFFVAVLLTALGLDASTSVLADDAGVRAGRDLAAKKCAACHALPAEDRNQKTAGLSFEEIANGSKATPEDLRAFLLSTQSHVGHPGAMPHPSLTEDQIRLVSAYILSLRK